MCGRVASTFSILLALLWPATHGFVVVGYLPEYRFGSVDWDGIVSRTTHIALFSLEPTEAGELKGGDRLYVLKRHDSGLRTALKTAGMRAPKILVTIGGAGRSAAFASVLNSKKTRKRLVRTVTALLQDLPLIAGIDLDWEAPQNTAQWRDLGKFARELRASMQSHHLLTMAYHPGSGAVGALSTLQDKSSKRGFVDMFDFCHSMAYARFDKDKRHTTVALAMGAIQEWDSQGLPLEKLTLGLAFFGVSRTTGEAMAYSDIIQQEPWLASKPSEDETASKYYFNNADTLRKKVLIAAQKGLAGVMIWEIGQDAPASAGSLLKHVYNSAREAAPGQLAAGGADGASWFDDVVLLISLWSPISEAHGFAALTMTVGSYMMLLVLFHNPARSRKPDRPIVVAKTATAVAADIAAKASDEGDSKGAEEKEAAEATGAPDASDHMEAE